MTTPDARPDDPSTVGKPGDPLMNPKSGAGYVVIGIGAIAFVLAIIAAANDLMGWLAIAVAVSAVCLLAGLAWVVYQRRHKKQVMHHTRPGVPPALRRRWRRSRGA